MNSRDYYKSRDYIIQVSSSQEGATQEGLLAKLDELDKEFYGETYETPNNIKQSYEKQVNEYLRHHRRRNGSDYDEDILEEDEEF